MIPAGIWRRPRIMGNPGSENPRHNYHFRKKLKWVKQYSGLLSNCQATLGRGD